MENEQQQPSEQRTSPAPLSPRRVPMRAPVQATLVGDLATARPLQPEDAAALFTMLGRPGEIKFAAPMPTTLAGFEQLVAAVLRDSRSLAFAIVPHGMEEPVGLCVLRSVAPQFEAAEWTFVLGTPFWGSGIYLDTAQLVLQFAFEVLGVHRLEARVAVHNGRGNGALLKIGAVQEGLLRRSLRQGDEYVDQVLWTVVGDEWSAGPAVSMRVH